jgi:hypothetical protein
MAEKAEKSNIIPNDDITYYYGPSNDTYKYAVTSLLISDSFVSSSISQKSKLDSNNPESDRVIDVVGSGTVAEQLQLVAIMINTLKERYGQIWLEELINLIRPI